MQTGLTASPQRLESWKRLQGENTNWTLSQDTQNPEKFDIWIDLDFDNHPDRLKDYAGNTKTIFLLSAVNITLEQAFERNGFKYNNEKMLGINAIPGFLERKSLELTNPFELNPAMFLNAVQGLGWENTEMVKSRVGMVTPRIVFMIINEAYYTFQEGTAAKEDIDTAMKLGTNYPKGPFEWCASAGIDNVYRCLDAVYNDTRDERYKICPALKTEWIKTLI